MVSALKRKEILSLAGDLNVPSTDIFVNYFGKKAAMGQGVPMMVSRFKIPLVLSWCERVAPFRYKGYFKRLDYQLTGDIKKDQAAIGQLFSTELEKVIRKLPTQYFWFNRRWKTRPEGDAKVY